METFRSSSSFPKARISEMAHEVQGYLDTLKHLELIHETRFFPELEYIFKHAVTQDVAYQSLLGQRRKELHGAIGQAMEGLYADRLEEQAAIVAYHYSRSENQEKAVEYSILAGDRAASLATGAGPSIEMFFKNQGDCIQYVNR